MKSLSTLVKDIYAFVTKPSPIPEEVTTDFGLRLGHVISEKLTQERGKPSLRMSNLGMPNRKLWYTINHPDLAEELSAPTRIKFLYGAILEEVVLFLAKISGHTVTDEQKETSINDVKGHIDGRIDSKLVDIKSASSYSFDKFSQGLDKSHDDFGYLTQLGSYASSLGDRDASFVVIDKTLGKICLDTHTFSGVDYKGRVEEVRTVLAGPIPERCYPDQKDGESGNRKLGVACSYCPFKKACWPGLRGFNYSGKPRYLTVVRREPNVDEFKE